MKTPHDRWQAEFLDAYRIADQENFTLIACPGAGKTKAAMRLARELIETGVIDQVYIVCPTRQVKRQWWKAAGKVGLELDPDWENGDCAISGDMSGVVTTYAAVNRQPDLHRKLAGMKRTLVIFDEIHHLEDEAAWGVSCKHAFEVASRRLMLSGTPFRTEGKIPFVEYEIKGGRQIVKADKEYPYWRAVFENVCRPIHFPRQGGKVEYDFNEKPYDHDFDDKLSDEQARHRLRAAIHADVFKISDIAEQIILDADRKLRELRAEGDTRAGGLVIAMGWDKKSAVRHANAIAEHMKRILRLPSLPPVVISDEPDALNIIERFQNGSEPWIVSINMISEGVDIPRLRVCAYLTNFVTRLYFLQVLGRIARGSDPAYCFIPDDWTLRDYAEQVYNERNQGLKEKTIPPGPGPEGPTGPPAEGVGFRFKDSEAREHGIIYGPHRIDRDEYNDARQQLENVWPAPVSHDVIAQFVLARRAQDRRAAGGEDSDGLLKSERKAQLRNQNNQLVAQYCMKTGQEFSVINNELNQQVGIRKLKLATEEQLIKRLDLVRQLLEGR